jgi:hypothetical protein
LQTHSGHRRRCVGAAEKIARAYVPARDKRGQDGDLVLTERSMVRPARGERRSAVWRVRQQRLLL